MLVIFDLDGTLTDSEEGITKSVQYALKQYGIDEDPKNLTMFIGPPLTDSFVKYFHFDKEQAKEAVEQYRVYYKKQGIFENKVYPGIPELLAALKRKGIRLAVGSSKPEVFVKQILDHFHIAQYFDTIVGSNLDGTLTDKKDIIETVWKKLGKDPDTVMVGDRLFDREGAEQTGARFVGVTYGFAGPGELDNIRYKADNAQEIETILLDMKKSCE